MNSKPSFLDSPQIRHAEKPMQARVTVPVTEVGGDVLAFIGVPTGVHKGLWVRKLRPFLAHQRPIRRTIAPSLLSKASPPAIRLAA